MLDYRFIKDNLEAVKRNIQNRNMKADADLVVQLFDRRTELTRQLQVLQEQRNENAASMKGKLDPETRNRLIGEGKKLKEAISKLQAELETVGKQLETEARRIPNMAHPEAPIGKEDTDNLEVKRVGIVPQFDFPPKDHVQLGQELDIIDFDSATKVTGNKFYYLNT